MSIIVRTQSAQTVLLLFGALGLPACEPSSAEQTTPDAAGVEPGSVAGDVDSSSLGMPCGSSAECGPGVECLAEGGSALLGGGPPGGLCTVDCSADASSCAKLMAGAVCLEQHDGDAYCFVGCSFGEAEPDKCRSHAGLACTPRYSATGAQCSADTDCGADQVCDDGQCLQRDDVCLPQCSQDQECSSGRTCDLGSAVTALGLCNDSLRAGLATGEACQTTDHADPCRGVCLDGTCADGCTVGAPGACGGDSSAACLSVRSDAATQSTFGDVGVCTLLCDCNDDCLNPAEVCAALEPGEQDLYNREGLCSPPTKAAPGLPCQGAGGTAGAGGTPSAP